MADGEDDQNALWESIDSGQRGPVEIIYVAKDEVDLEEIEEWGAMTGWWSLRVVRSMEDAVEEHRREQADMVIHLGCEIEEAENLADIFPSLPQSVATHGGFDRFPPGWPDQVVVFQWAAPRPTEFGDAIADALGKVATEVIYEANKPDLVIFKAVSEELLARLSKFPEDRFLIDPRVFEETVAELLARMGYSVRLTPRSGDKGRDVIASIGTPAAPVLMLVECKRYAEHRLVGPEPVTRLWFRMFDDHANMAMVVTTSGFQPVARDTARSRGYQITLKDGDDFIGWIRSLRAQ